MSEKSNVPALERGLDILEFVAVKGDATYSQIIDGLALPSASAARILKCLCLRNYLQKDPATGVYRMGKAPGKLGVDANGSDTLLAAGEPVLKQLRDQTKQTAILFYWNRVAWECIAKATHEDALTMQNVGEIRVDIFGYPWGVFAYRQLLKEDRRLVLDLNKHRMDKASRSFERKGCVVSKGSRFNRYTVPILAANGDLVGALAMGVIHLGDDSEEASIIDMLVRGGKQIEEQIRR